MVCLCHQVKQRLGISAREQAEFPELLSTRGRSWHRTQSSRCRYPHEDVSLLPSLRRQKAAARTSAPISSFQLGGGWDGRFTFSQPALDFCTARNIFPGCQLQSLLRSDRFKLRFVRQHPKV